jgi:hypothetical protein
MFPVLLLLSTGVARDVVDVKFNPQVHEYCHILNFSSGWQMPKFFIKKNGQQYFPSKFSLYDDFEFRVRGLLGTVFLVRGVENVVNDYYTANMYEADFSDPRGIATPVSEETWNSATVVPALGRYSVPKDVKFHEAKIQWIKDSKALEPMFIEFQGHKFGRTGQHWGDFMISPDRSIVIMQSWTGKLNAPGGDDIPGDTSVFFKFGRNRGKLFFDVYNADTGKKLTTITAGFRDVLPNDDILHKTVWVTERYFIVPLDENRKRCLICEFGRKQ